MHDAPRRSKLLSMIVSTNMLLGMAKTPAPKPRNRGSIRTRGSSYQVRVYAGTNPETGEEHYLTETHTDPKEAEKARTRLVALADARKAPLSNNTFAVAVRKWLDSR